MSTHIYEYLYLTRQERNGLFVLIITSVLIVFAPSVYSFLEKKETTDFSYFQNEIKFFFESENIAASVAFTHKKNGEKNFRNEKHAEEKEIKPFLFDPNIVSKEDFIRLGIASKTAQTIINFRNKGAKFFKKEDFKKVYGLKTTDYERLKDFIKIKKPKRENTSFAKKEFPQSYDMPVLNPTPFDPNTADENVLLQNGVPKNAVATILKYRTAGGSFKTKEDLKKIYTLKEEIYNKIEPFIQIEIQEKKTIVKASAERKNFPKKEFKEENYKIDINESTAEDWQNLRGIGPSFSKRIVNYRNKLGGFYSIEQVGETYGLPDSSFQKIRPQLESSSTFNKINLNHVTEEELKKHPYFSWNQAKVILSYRTMHGDFGSINDLLKIGALKKDWFEKVKYYLEL